MPVLSIALGVYTALALPCSWCVYCSCSPLLLVCILLLPLAHVASLCVILCFCPGHFLLRVTMILLNHGSMNKKFFFLVVLCCLALAIAPSGVSQVVLSIPWSSAIEFRSPSTPLYSYPYPRWPFMRTSHYHTSPSDAIPQEVFTHHFVSVDVVVVAIVIDDDNISHSWSRRFLYEGGISSPAPLFHCAHPRGHE